MPKVKFKNVSFERGGHYAIPRLERLVSLGFAGHLDLATLQFECEGGGQVLVPISSQALEPLAAALEEWKGKLKLARPTDATRH